MTKRVKKPPVLVHDGPGRPSPYRPEFNEQAHRLCLLGYTDKRLAEFFGVKEITINRWKRDKPGFKEAIHSGKDEADGRVVSALMQRALGYSHPEVDIRVIDGQIVKTEIVKHYPPDTPAAMFWLTNRQKGTWKTKHEDPEDADAVPTPVQVTVVVQDARKPGGDGADA